MFTGYQGNFSPSIPVTIASGQGLSAVIPTEGFSLCGIQIPAAFTGTALTFQACATASGTFQPVYNSAGAVSYTVAQGRYIAIDPKDFQGIAFLIIVSGSNEGASRSFTCSLKGF